MKPKSVFLIRSIVLLFLCLCTYSQTCSHSQYFNGQRCAPCKTNCQCSFDNTCDNCLPGYAFDARFQSCLQCPIATDAVNVGCKQCCSQIKGTAFVCSQCPILPNVFLKGGQCIKVQGCTNLLDSGVCTFCQNGYYLMEGKCLVCDASCKTCRDNTLCETCADGYFNSTNINFSFCTVCPAGCKTCSSLTFCQSCNSGYDMVGTLCQACTSNCLTCSAGACSACSVGSTLISGVCYLCTNATKSGTTGCIECSTVNNLISCTKAASSYYLNSANQSILCSSTFPNSLLCTNSGPIQCLNDYHATLTSRYHLVSNQCIANSRSCKMMENTKGECSSCYFEDPGMYFKLSNKECVKCDQLGCQAYNSECQCLQCQQRYRYVNNLCVVCQNLHCTKCQSDIQSCQKCAFYYGLFSSACVVCSKSNCLNCDGDYTVCKQCEDGYYLSSGSCYLCQTNCLLCESNIKCKKCASNYYLQPNGRCKAKPTNCIDVDSRYLASNVAVCKKCIYGYKVIEGNCYPCSQALYNLNTCEKYCPSYYALRAYKSTLSFAVFTAIALLFLIIFL